MRIAVAGATGTVGRHVVEVARERGHEVVGLTRSAGVDLTTGEGLAARLEAVDVVVDVTSTRAQSRKGAEAFFGSVTRTLTTAERAAGIGHHVALSIIGIDRVPSGYYRGKQLQERLLADGDTGQDQARLAGGATGAVHHHHLEQRGGVGAAVRVDRAHHRLEGHVGVRERLQVRGPDPVQDLGESGVAGQVGAQHQGVDEEPDDLLQRLVRAARDGGEKLKHFLLTSEELGGAILTSPGLVLALNNTKLPGDSL